MAGKYIFFDCTSAIEPLRCFQCTNFETSSLVGLKMHCKADHTLPDLDEKRHYCKSCSFRTYSKYLFLRHELFNLCVKNTEGTRNSQFRLRNDADSPINDHETAKLLKMHFERFKCKRCDFETDQRHTLLDHCVDCHNSEEEVECFQCLYCPYRTSSQSILGEHLKQKHDPGKNKLFKCEHCPHVTHRISNLRIHILLKHTDPDTVELLECEYCPYKCKLKSLLKNHMAWRHSTQPNLKCAHCEYETKIHQTLRIHVLMKHFDPTQNRWFECERCPYKTTNKCDLRKHMGDNHKNKTTFKCERCPFKSRVMHRVQTHILMEHPDLTDNM